jgi:hypothetical protein
MKRPSRWYAKIGPWLARFVHVQLFITLISLPILASWGLSVSVLTIIGNLVFAPFLSSFLFLSSLLFFAELVHLPHDTVSWFFEKLANLWLSILGIAGSGWLMALPKPPWWWCLVVPLSAVGAVVYTIHRGWYHKIGSLLLIMGLSCGYLKLVQVPTYLKTSIVCAQGLVDLVHMDGVTILIDAGATARLPSPEIWVEYTLVPELNRLFGTANVDCYIFLQPSARAFKAAQTLIELKSVRQLCFPYWHGVAQPALLRAYGFCKRTALAHGVVIKRISKEPVIIPAGKESIVTLMPKKKYLSKAGISFPAIITQST